MIEICSVCGVEIPKEKVLIYQYKENGKNYCEPCVNKASEGWYKRKYDDRVIRKPNRKTRFLT
jgi:hypothetical protein